MVPSSPGRHQFAGVPDHGVAGVVVGQGEQPAAGLDRRDEVFGLRHRRGHRLVADDVDAGIQEGACGWVVQVVGRHDGDGVDAVFAGGFRPGHLGEVGIGPVRCDEEVGGAVAGAFRIAGERAGDQFPAVVQACRDAVDGADEGAPAAADHAQAQPAPRGAVLGGHGVPPRLTGQASGGSRHRRCRLRRSRRRRVP